MPFTSRDAVKRALRIPLVVTDNDELIDELINAIHGVILADVGGGLSAAEPTSYSSYFDIDRAGMSGLRLPQWPVQSITSVKTGTANGAAGTTLAATEYSWTAQGTLRLQGVASESMRGAGAYWPVGRQNVRVTWVAGFVQDSKEARSMELAEKLTVCQEFNTIGAAGKSSERIGNYSYTMASGKTGAPGGSVYPPVAERLIARYRNAFVVDTVVP